MNFPGDEPSKAIHKLAEVAHVLIAPFATRMQARAEAYRLTTVTQAEIESAELKQRAAMSAQARQIRHQISMENIVRMTHEEQLKLPDAPNKEPVDPDWLARFETLARDILDEDVQRLWAKILAGEISRPGHFSVRSLNVLSVMTKAEAEKFCLLCKFVAHSLDGQYSYQIHSEQTDDYVSQEFGLTSSVYALLREIGLLEASTTHAIVLKRCPPGTPHDVRYTERRFRLSSDYDDIGLRVRTLTNTGRQLFELCNSRCADEPLQQYIRFLSTYSPHIKIQEITWKEDSVFCVPPEDAVILNG
jgi:hypothetical protein